MFGQKTNILQRMYEATTREVAELKRKASSPKSFLESILKRDIRHFKWEDLKPGDRQKYYEEAQFILKSSVFQNEINFLISDFAMWALKESEDFESVRDMRMSVSGMLKLKERLESIAGSAAAVPNTDPKSPI